MYFTPNHAPINIEMIVRTATYSLFACATRDLFCNFGHALNSQRRLPVVVDWLKFMQPPEIVIRRVNIDNLPTFGVHPNE